MKNVLHTKLYSEVPFDSLTKDNEMKVLGSTTYIRAVHIFA